MLNTRLGDEKCWTSSTGFTLLGEQPLVHDMFILTLKPTSVQADMDLPVISVIGSQSAGKSSLIESISGIKLPRASGTCTR